MSKLVAFALIGAAFAAPALAAPAPAAEETSFTRDGHTYSFTTVDMGSYTRIRGRDDSGRTFDVRRAGTRVVGYYGDRFVDFAAPAAAEPTRVAAR